jgi:PiT family inorganic phosphate transporter
MQGFCAEKGGAISLFAATWLGIPVWTTHTIIGSIVGIGAARKLSAVRWNFASNIVVGVDHSVARCSYHRSAVALVR